MLQYIGGFTPWIGVAIPEGNIACHGFSTCLGQPIWIDGTQFNYSYYSSITAIEITIGHKCGYLYSYTVIN
jgi:hypothetical protein